jgi:RNA-binding protein FUS
MSGRDLFVRQLSFRTSVEGLRQAFTKYGELAEVKIPMGDNGRSKGFGFVTFRNEQDAAAAVREMNGYNLDGFNIIVQFSEKRGGGGDTNPRPVGGERRPESNLERDVPRGGQYQSRRRSRSPQGSSRRNRSPPQSSASSRPSQSFSTTSSSNVPYGDTSSSRPASQYPPQAPSQPFIDAPPMPPQSQAWQSRGAPSHQQHGGRGFRGHQQDDGSALEAKIYISGLPPNTTEDMLAEHFSMSGAIARKRVQKKFKDQWPYNIKLYYDDNGAFKGDALLAYEDPNAAKTAPEFFDGSDFHGVTISVQPARKT